jgi:hypothetical protein
MIPEPSQLLIPPRVRATLVDMSATIHFDNQAQSRREKVRDESPAHRHLPPENHTEAAGRKAPARGGLPIEWETSDAREPEQPGGRNAERTERRDA